MKYSHYTNSGPSKTNEDSCFVTIQNNKIYACIADGVGGFGHGDYASKFVTDTFSDYVIKSKNIDLSEFIINTNSELINNANEELKVSKIGTTFTASIISDNLIMGVHIGDSRICVLRGNGLKQLTDEHNEAVDKNPEYSLLKVAFHETPCTFLIQLLKFGTKAGTPNDQFK